MNYEKRYQKWEEVARKYKVDNSRIATFKLTVENVLRLLKNKKEGLALDVGCGFGYIDILLAKNTNFRIIAIDISDTALENAKKIIDGSGFRERITVEKGDVYKLSYPDNYFDAIFSFGYVSAASYPGVAKEVARVLKPGGLLILDYINHRSLYKIFSLPKKYKKYKKGDLYSFNIKGIAEHFKNVGLSFFGKIYFNTYPPVFKNLIPVWLYILFEKTIGRLLGRILGRVIVISFKKG